jgi:hypothetical protein
MSTGILAFPRTQYESVQFQGGLDLVTPTLKVKPGVVRDSLNFEIAITGGYSRIGGYERFDGRAKPSAATYSTLQVEVMTNVPAIGDTITGETTLTTAKVIAVGTNYVIVTLVVGAGFSSTEVLKVGVTIIGVSIPLNVTFTPLQNAQFLALAANVYRALILAVPGSGPVRGVFAMNISGTHTVFAFRNNAGGTGADLYKSTAGGWTQVAYLKEVAFTAGGATMPADGATLTQGGVTATIKRVCTQSGSWGTPTPNTAAGRFIITTPSGGNFGAGAATITGGINVTLSGIQTAITMSPGGKFQFDTGNFFGQSFTQRVYGCDNVNRCFEFDGETLAPITTGLTTDAPTNIAVHQNHLLISYGSSLFNSGIGQPFNWTAIAGAAEIAVGDIVDTIKVMPGDQTSPAMFIGCRNSYRMLYGTAAVGADLFRVVTFNTGTGAAAYSAQNMDQIYVLDDRGVISLRASQEFGNFNAAALTFNISPYVKEKRASLTYSCLNKERSQYRLFFSDGSALFSTIVNGKYLGSMPIKYANSMHCAWNGELSNGDEVTYAGDSNGFVHQLDTGSSCDGALMDFYLVPNWNAIRSPRLRKRYRKASLEMQGTSYCALQFSWQLGYASKEFAVQAARTYESNFSGVPVWDSGITWDTFVWDGTTLGPIEIEMSGTAENIQPKLANSSDIMYAFTVNSLILHFTPRRPIR